MIAVPRMKNIVFILISSFLLMIAQLSCTKNAGEPAAPHISSTELKITESYTLDILEPSGLCKAWNPNEYLVVSDNSNTIFRINQQGIVLEEFPFEGEDLEGVCYQEAGKLIWVVDEKTNTLFKLNKAGVKIKEYELSYGSHSSNKGLEGITVNTSNNHIYMLNEASPGLLIEFFNNEIVQSIDLNFALDYSGIYYDSEFDLLWIVSHESKSIYQCSTAGRVLHTYSHSIAQAEGIVVNWSQKEFYIVCDTDEKLYKLELK